MAAAKPSRVSETVRERETFKYDALAFSTARLHGPQPPPPIASSMSALTSAPDPGLTAFAQLGLYTLNATRSLISLFDRRYQHIVAEAVRPPPPGKEHAPYFNGLTFERVTSVCEHVVSGDAVEHTYPGTPSGLSVEDLPVSVINHLDADSRFCHIQDPARQFYAGVPIRSPGGINIGVYCVFDDKPRPHGLGDDEVRFIRDMSLVIMDYLAYKRSHDWYHREQRMVRGLGSFVEGEPALRVPEGTTELAAASSAQVAEAPEIRQSNQPTTAEQQQGPASQTHTAVAASTGQADGPARTPGGRTLSVPRPTTSRTGSASSLSNKNGSKKPVDQLRSGVDRVFSRAAKVIRESLEVEGVVFMDASIRSYGGLVGNTSVTTPPLSDVEVQQSSLESGSSDDSVRGPALDTPRPKPASCAVLGFANSRSSSMAGDATPAEFAVCKERFLQRLLQKYPKGRIFNFEADGALSDQSASSGGDEVSLGSAPAPLTAVPSSLSESGSNKPRPKPKLRQSAADCLINMFPGARSVAVVPLWDPQTGRSFAGGFHWTKNPTRVFSRENELSYMRVFGLITMAEVARLKIRAADKAKTDILGSISHELRSPLHGLVGTIEMLRHTALDGFQKSVLWTTDASARTLLDTIDHLLDFIKINNPRPSRTRRRAAPILGQLARSNPSAHASMTVLETPSAISLDSLVEEVVESVLAGSSYLTMSETQLHSSHPSQPAVEFPATVSAAPIDRGPVQIYVDIDYLADWSFRVHPGALRRIVMNLFGNALKFTRHGFIRVSLRQERQSKRRTAAGTTNVVLTVSDSGKGIGEDYLRDHLFTPFSQEDEFAPGTGLGLSLVHRMVSAAGGSIDVVSKVGKGTTITVVLPLPHVADESANGLDEQSEFGQDVRALAGRRVRLCHFDNETKIRDGFLPEDAKQKSQLQLMKGICRDLLHMQVLCGGEGDPPPDFVISRTDIGTRLNETAVLMDTCPHVFICQDLASAHRIMSSQGGVSRLGYEVLTQPVGPRKLARSLLAALLRQQLVQNSDTGVGMGPDVAELTPRAQTPQDVASLSVETMAVKEPGLWPVAPEAQDVVATQQGSCLLVTPIDIPTPPEEPLPLQPAEGTPPTSDTPDATVAQPKSVLIVDDNAINLKILAAYMTKLKYDYTTAENGLEAVELYTRDPARYSCVLTDISMPVMDGLEATRRIRALERAGGHPPAVVIALTGLHGAEIEQDAVASGVDLFLTRPLVLGRLKDALLAAGLQQKS